MDWEKALLKIDVVKDKKNIICDINGVSKNPDEGVCGINNLIAKYKEPKHRCFIQKYAETRLATESIQLTISALFIALAALMLSLIALYSDRLADLLRDFVAVIFVVIALTWYIYLVYYVNPRINRDKAIIIAIEAAKLDKSAKKNLDAEYN